MKTDVVYQEKKKSEEGRESESTTCDELDFSPVNFNAVTLKFSIITATKTL